MNIAEGIRPKVREKKKEDNFPTPALMGVKKLGREICEGHKRLGKSKRHASLRAVSEIHRRLPEFVSALERETGRPYKGDEWLRGRIDHQSDAQENKGSHARLQQVVMDLVSSGETYTWKEWEELIERGSRDVVLVQFLYLLPLREGASPSYTVQKIGITSNLVARYTEHCSRCPRGEMGGAAWWPADDYVLWAELGAVPENEARALESKCAAAIGNGQPPVYGDEWFRISPTEAFEAVLRVLYTSGITPRPNYDMLEKVRRAGL